MYTQADVDRWIAQWMESSEGKQKLKALGAGNYTPEEMQSIAKQLAQDIIGAFLSIQRGGSHPGGGTGFDDKGIRVRPLKNNGVSVSFPSKLLERRSLVKYDGTPTGTGVYDIFGLFTQGWSYPYYVYGSWDDAYADTQRPHWHHAGYHDRSEIRSRKEYGGNPFISRVVGEYTSKYPGLDIKYPSKWGG